MSEIFVVDDDPSVGTALSLILSGGGYEVTSFDEGEAFPDGGAVAHARLHSARRPPPASNCCSGSTRNVIRRRSS
jgi:CheY-like chemotaxis protein